MSTADLMKAAEYVPKGIDVRAMRLDWIAWCKAKDTVPETPVAHFISFLKAHKKRNTKYSRLLWPRTVKR